MGILYERYPQLSRASRETIRKIVSELEIYRNMPRKGEKKRYRHRFEASAFGQLIQGDVSEHFWIPNCKPFSLLVFMDDHTRYILYADFIESDNMHSHIKALKEIIYKYGRPNCNILQ